MKNNFYELYNNVVFDKDSKIILYPHNDFPKLVHRALGIVESLKQKDIRDKYDLWSPEAVLIALTFNIDIFKLINTNEATNVHTLPKDPYEELNEKFLNEIKKEYNEKN